MSEEERFETLFAALEERARKLDAGGMPLEESVKTYEEGAELAAKLRALLEQTELRIRELDSRYGAPEALDAATPPDDEHADDDA